MVCCRSQKVDTKLESLEITETLPSTELNKNPTECHYAAATEGLFKGRESTTDAVSNPSEVMSTVTQTNSKSSTGVDLVGLGSKRSQELLLLLQGLETTVTVLGRSIDELEVDRLQVGTSGRSDNTLAESDGALLGTSDGTLEHDPVLVDPAVVREATNRVDALLGQVRLGGSRGSGILLLANAQHTLVDLGTVMVTLLTGTSHGELNAGRVPRTDTGDLAETTVSLAGKTGDTPTGDDTDETVTLGGSAGIKNLALTEDLLDRDLLLEQTVGEVNLGGNITTVDLDLHQVGNLLAKSQLLGLGVGQDADDSGVLLDALQLLSDDLRLGSGLLGVLGEGLALGAVPVLVETTLDFVRQVSGPDGGESAKTVRGGDVANKTDDDHRRSLQDGDSLDGLLLVELGARTLDFTNDVGHTSLVADEGSQVRRKGGVITREGSDSAVVMLGALLGQVLERTVTRSFVLSVRHFALVSRKNYP